MVAENLKVKILFMLKTHSHKQHYCIIVTSYECTHYMMCFGIAALMSK